MSAALLFCRGPKIIKNLSWAEPALSAAEWVERINQFLLRFYLLTLVTLGTLAHFDLERHKSRTFLFITFDFSCNIWYNTQVLAFEANTGGPLHTGSYPSRERYKPAGKVQARKPSQIILRMS